MHQHSHRLLYYWGARALPFLSSIDDALKGCISSTTVYVLDLCAGFTICYIQAYVISFSYHKGQIMIMGVNRRDGDATLGVNVGASTSNGAIAVKHQYTLYKLSYFNAQ